MARLDYIFIPHSFLGPVSTESPLTCPFSDHRLVRITLNPCHSQRGKCFWKLRVSLLDREDYRLALSHFPIYDGNISSLELENFLLSLVMTLRPTQISWKKSWGKGYQFWRMKWLLLRIQQRSTMPVRENSSKYSYCDQERLCLDEGVNAYLRVNAQLNFL